MTFAVDDDGIILAAECHHFDDAGSYPMPGGCAGPLVGMLFTGALPRARTSAGTAPRSTPTPAARPRTADRG